MTMGILKIKPNQNKVKTSPVGFLLDEILTIVILM